jgi:hypothetical protein
LGARSRKRGRTQPRPGGAPASEQPTPTDAREIRAARTEAKNAAVRARLEPLAPGERPGWVTAAAILAAALGVLNIGLYAAGVRATGGTFTGAVGVGVILLVAAAGMWRAQYWAVLGFEVLLGVTAVISGLSLMLASSVGGAIRAIIVFAVSVTFFYKLIRGMARIQMPARPGSEKRLS